MLPNKETPMTIDQRLTFISDRLGEMVSLLGDINYVLEEINEKLGSRQKKGDPDDG